MMKKTLGSRMLTAVMLEAVSTSETSVDFHETARRNIAVDSHYHGHRSFENNCHEQ
jgi:hypothetical protein